MRVHHLRGAKQEHTLPRQLRLLELRRVRLLDHPPKLGLLQTTSSDPNHTLLLVCEGSSLETVQTLWQQELCSSTV
mgnify:CR=1